MYKLQNSTYIIGLLTWSLRHTPRIKEPTHEMNPDRKALNGNVPTKQQYKNWITPVKKT